MQCDNCGMQLVEGEMTCSRCGTPVNGGQHYHATKTVIQQQIPMGQITTGQVQQQVQQMPQKEEKKKNDGGRKFLIILIVLSIIALLSIMVYSVVLKPTESKNKNNNKTPSSGEKDEKKEVEQDYGGYTFSIPEGYQYRISSTYGLIIYNEKESYSITVDYTNPYETRKTTYMTQFPDQASTLVASVANREYLALVITVPNVGYATQYATVKTEKANFIGLVVKSDYTTPGAEEFTNLTAILDSAKQKEEISPGDTNKDAGVAGIKVYTIDFNEFFPTTQEQSQSQAVVTQ